MSKIFVIIGCSGSGKSTIAKMVSKNQIISTTTRDKRTGEKHEIDYIFLTDKEYVNLDKYGYFIEKNTYDGFRYGVTKSEVEYRLNQGDAVVVLDIYGYRQFKDKMSNVVSIFIYSDIKELRKRMIKRGNSADEIERRLAKVRSELMNRFECDYVVCNKEGKLNETVDIVKAIMKSERDN